VLVVEQPYALFDRWDTVTGADEDGHWCSMHKTPASKSNALHVLSASHAALQSARFAVQSTGVHEPSASCAAVHTMVRHDVAATTHGSAICRLSSTSHVVAHLNCCASAQVCCCCAPASLAHASSAAHKYDLAMRLSGL
jgi:hypothetical protein